jgi:hypothetical protein
MQAAQHAARGARDIGLHEAHVETGVGEALRVETFVEEAARVAVHGGFDDDAARQVGLDDLHARACLTSCCRYWP